MLKVQENVQYLHMFLYYINVEVQVNVWFMFLGASFKLKFSVNVQILYEGSDNSHRPLSNRFSNHSREVMCEQWVRTN